jgi:radical SAM/Cys-rich protein
MSIKSLHARHHRLAEAARQVEFLSEGKFAQGELPPFSAKLKELNKWPLRPGKLEILQVNLGYMCNQVCKHCHVDAGPDRKEIMTRETMSACLEVLRNNSIPTLDITGGAPEMNPDFRWFVQEARKVGVQEIIVRSNLTIFLANPKYHDLPQFFKENDVRLCSSLPFYTAAKTDRQRGDGVFGKSIEALKMLNAVGYGQPETSLLLDLVYNPAGAFLPTDQNMLEREFKQQLLQQYGISFNRLFTITNLPISRFLDYLIETENYEEYMEKLVGAFNPAAVDGVMCRNTLSVGYDGALYDCDFNQMLHMKVAPQAAAHISEFNMEILHQRPIVVSQHCYGCTAGAGSSCQGTLT